MQPRGLPGGNLQEFRLHRLARDHRLDGFGNLLDTQPQAIGDHGHRLGQAVVLDDTRGHFFFELLKGHSRADFLLQRQAALRGIDDADSFGSLDALRDRRERQHQLIHHESGVHAGAHQRHAPVFGCGIELRCDSWMLAERVGELFAGGDHTRFCCQTLQQLLCNIR